MDCKTWEAKQGLSPSSPESWFAERAWDAACEELERLRAENDALRKDAERYKWIRDVGTRTYPPLIEQWRLSGEDPDTIIDRGLRILRALRGEGG